MPVLKCDKRIFCSSDLISGISSGFTPNQHGIFLVVVCVTISWLFF